MNENEMKKKFTILAVDDLIENLTLLKMILVKEGYVVHTADSGEEALDVMSKSSFDLILLDIMMPGMSGLDVCKIIKSNPEYSSIPIIFLTAKVSSEDIVAGFECGASDYITKPFNNNELKARVKTHLALKESQELNKLYIKELEELNINKDKFFSIVAHDLKNPMQGLLGLAEILSEHYEHIEKKEKIEIAKELYETSEKLYNLLENLLDWSRIQMKAVSIAPQRTNLKECVDNATETLRHVLKLKNIRVINSIKPDLCAWSDKYMTETIFRNLIGNAVKFSQNGGEVNIEGGVNDSKVWVEVIDNGVGMSNEKVEQIFSGSINKSTNGTAKETGTGLGLALCKYFADRNQGKLTASSKLGLTKLKLELNIFNDL